MQNVISFQGDITDSVESDKYRCAACDTLARGQGYKEKYICTECFCKEQEIMKKKIVYLEHRLKKIYKYIKLAHKKVEGPQKQWPHWRSDEEMEHVVNNDYNFRGWKISNDEYSDSDVDSYSDVD